MNNAGFGDILNVKTSAVSGSAEDTMNQTKPLSITFVTGPASAGFAETLMDHMTRSITTDQLFIISSHAYSEMQTMLTSRHLPCRLLTRQQIPGWIAQKAGIEETDVADEHSRIRILEEILADPDMDFQFLSYSDHPETAARDLGTLIGRLQKSGVGPEQLREILKRKFVSSASKARFHDLLTVLEAYLAVLRKQGRLSREDFALDMAGILTRLNLNTGSVFTGVLDDYDYVTRKLLAAILLKADTVYAALPQMPPGREKQANAHYRRAAAFYRDLIREIRIAADRPVNIQYIPAQETTRTSALDALSRWLEDSANPMPADDESIRLVQCLTMDDELLLAAGAISELVTKGVSPSDILVTGASIGNWHDRLSRLLAAGGLDSVYYQGDTLARSSIFGYFSSLLGWLEHSSDSAFLSRLLQYQGLGLTESERQTLQRFIQAQGPDIEGGLKRLQEMWEAERNSGTDIHRSDTDQELKDVTTALAHLNQLTGGLRYQLDHARTTGDFCTAILDHAQHGTFLPSMQAVWEKAKTEDVSLANSLEQQWKAFNRMILQLQRSFGSEASSLDEFRTLMDQTADEVIVTTQGQRQLSVQMEPLHSARTIHCRHLFLLGAGSDEIPVLPNPAFLTDQETGILIAAGIDFRNNRDWADESASDASTAIANTGESVWISWHIRNQDQELEPAALFKPLIQSLTVDDRSDRNVAEDEFLQDSIRLQSLKGTPEYEQFSGILQMKYGSSERYAGLLEKADAWIHQEFGTVDKTAAASLFADTDRLSVTSLESYNQCPFRFFMQRGVQAKDPKTFEETSADRGSFLHAVLSECLPIAVRNGLRSQDTEALRSLLEETASRLLTTHNRRILESGGLMEYEKTALLQAAAESLDLVMKQGDSSEFKPEWLEYSIGDRHGFPMTLPDGRRFYLTGIADRADVWTASDGTRYGRVIDYKSGRDRKALNRDTIESGLKLQPPLYLHALAQEKNLQPAGMYYDRLKTEVLKLKADQSPASSLLDEKRRSTRQMTGYTLADPKILEASDTGYDPDSPGLFVSGSIPLSTTTKGAPKAACARSLVSSEEMSELIALAVTKCQETIAAIQAGDIKADPQKDDGKSPCTWCPFRTACHRRQTS